MPVDLPTEIDDGPLKLAANEMPSAMAATPLPARVETTG